MYCGNYDLGYLISALFPIFERMKKERIYG